MDSNKFGIGGKRIAFGLYVMPFSVKESFQNFRSHIKSLDSHFLTLKSHPSPRSIETTPNAVQPSQGRN